MQEGFLWNNGVFIVACISYFKIDNILCNSFEVTPPIVTHSLPVITAIFFQSIITAFFKK